MEDLLNKIESYGFQCEAGPLTLCQDWMKLRVHLLLAATPTEPRGAAEESAEARWISVDDRLPEKFTEVLVAFKDCTLPACAQYTNNPHDIDGWCYPAENRGDGFDWTITHWMPLPITPAEAALRPQGEKP